MTRPMPGPPEHDVRAFPHRSPHEAFSVIPCAVCIGEMYPESFMKRLTDAECAAEYWRAEAKMLYFDPHCESEAWSAAVTEERTWHRFATHPHASQGDPQ